MMTNNSRLTLPERIAALRVLKRQIEEAWKDSDGEVRDALMASQADELAPDRIPLRVGGIEVGKASYIAAKVEPSIVPGREAEALAFLREHGLTEEVPRKGWKESIVYRDGHAAHAGTGEICEAIDFTPAKAAYVRYTGLQADKVREAFHARGIDTVDTLKLIGGTNE